MWSLILALACSAALPTPTSGPPAPALAVPAYFYPGPLWARMAQARPSLVVANPNSGPGAAVDPNYTRAITLAEQGGATVIGYVSTAYGARSQADVLADIDRWYALYPVQGIFLDEGPDTSTCNGLQGWYQTVAAHITARDPQATIALNPGTDTCASYLQFIDVLLVFEDTAARFSQWTAPAWMANYSADRFWILAHNTPGNRLQDVIRRASTQGVGLVYVTHDRLPNPWDTLPPYWSNEAALTAP